MGDLVHLRLDTKMRKAMKFMVKHQFFASESEFIRDSIRKNLELYEKYVALKALEGSARRLTKKEQEERKKLNLSSEELFRRYGLD